MYKMHFWNEKSHKIFCHSTSHFWYHFVVRGGGLFVMDSPDHQITSSGSGIGKEKSIKGLMDPMCNPKALDDLAFRNIIDLLPCYLSIQDRSMHILFANQNFKDDFGEGIGKLCHEVYKGSPERCEFCPVQKTFEDNKVHISEETVQLTHLPYLTPQAMCRPLLKCPQTSPKSKKCRRS